MHWNKLHVKREGLHHILGSLKKDVLSDVCNISALACFTCLFFPITDEVFRLPFNLSDGLTILTMCRQPLGILYEDFASPCSQLFTGKT